MQSLIETFRTELSSGQLVLGDEIAARATSYWDSTPTRAAVIVMPHNTEQVSFVMRECHRHQQSLVVQGGLTGCVAGAVAAPEQVIMSLEKMNAIESIDPVGGTATVGAGAVLQTVQEAVAAQGLIFPLDLGARGSCTIGGNVATNAGGINVIRYGMMRNLVLGLEAVLADGTVLSSMNRMLKNNAGYDIKQLFVGTEGTLGVVTRVVLRLFPAPVSSCSAMVALDSFAAVTELLQMLQRDLAGTLSAYEVMWGEYFRAVTEPGWHRAPMAREYPFYVMVQAEGADPVADAARFESLLESALTSGLIVDAVVPKSESENRALWAIREDFEAILKPPPVYLYDVSLPIADMAAYVDAVRARVAERWRHGECYTLGHIGDGNLHFFIATAEAGEWHQACDECVYEPLQQYGGSVSAEHGIGTEKRGWLSLSRSEAEIEMMRRLKNALDPQAILNPGVVIQ